ncbi:putative sulfate exporter family transporter [Taylorella asinigenitalis]|uniref:putative sulfate exporter family transporter n=1 Tax=Taylorella asinigenitalis TaxID=84590 RepID=UPI0009DF4D5E|nr:putative sulfate exporter family transporter [Taylorella asinigenitalis]
MLGALVGNIVPRILKLVVLSGVYAKCTREALRLGIILYGFRITLDQIMLVGYEGIAYAFIIVLNTFFVGFFASRAMGLDRQSASLISSGSAYSSGES